MKPQRLTLLFPVLLLISICSSAIGQDLQNPGDYISAISKARGDMEAKYMQYMSAAAHGRRARKVEKLRLEVLDNINQSKYNTIGLPIYKGDNSLRQGSIDYIQFCFRVFNEDYKKIVNMEELAEQSFDEMQAYLLLQEKIEEKLHEASQKLSKTTHDFASKYNVNLIDEKTPLTEKMEVAGNLNRYINSVYLIFFKCNWEDSKLVEAMNAKKVNDVEQARSALLSYANEGLKGLDTLRTFENDGSLSTTCREVLEFYKKAADKDVPKLTDFFLKQEEWEKIKKTFDDKPAGQRKQPDIDAYNKGVKDINDAGKSFNQTNETLNKGRTQALNDWNSAEKKFADTHMPYYHG